MGAGVKRLEIKKYTQANTKAQDTHSVHGSEWTVDTKAKLSFWSTGIIATLEFSGCAQKLRSPVSFYYASAEPGTWELNTKPCVLHLSELPGASQMAQAELWYLLSPRFWLMSREEWVTLCKHRVKYRNFPAACQPLSVVLHLPFFFWPSECWIPHCIRFPL